MELLQLVLKTGGEEATLEGTESSKRLAPGTAIAADHLQVIFGKKRNPLTISWPSLELLTDTPTVEGIKAMEASTLIEDSVLMSACDWSAVFQDLVLADCSCRSCL